MNKCDKTETDHSSREKNQWIPIGREKGGGARQH